jgi:hypothetical protein
MHGPFEVGDEEADVEKHGPFEVGSVVLYGKYKRARGKIISFGTNPKGQVTVEIEPIPKGRKKNRILGLYKIWTLPQAPAEAVSSDATMSFQKLIDEARSEVFEAGLRTRVDVKIDGWQGKQTIPPKQLRAFSADLKAAIPSVGFLPAQGQLVQLDKKHLSKLDAVLKKHGLRIGVAPRPATNSYLDIVKPTGKVRHRVPPSRKNW